MKVAVVAVGVVEDAADREVRMVPVRDRLVPAAGLVPLAAFHGGAGSGAAPAHLQTVLVRVPFVRGVEVPVVQVVGVVSVADLPVPAPRSVPVLVVRMLAAGHVGRPDRPPAGFRRQSSPAALRSRAGVSS